MGWIMVFQPNGAAANSISTFLYAGIALLLLRIALSLADPSFTVFFTFDDLFADSLKSGMAQTSVSRPLLTDPRVAEWPQIFQGYLFHNDYLSPNFSIRHSTPVAMLKLMGVAWLLQFLSPLAVIGLLTAVYVGLAWLIARALTKWSGIARPALLLLPMLLSFPALFMLNRANFLSGFTSLGVIFYLATCTFRRARWAGWLALALAINLRPNVAVFILMELCREKRPIDAIRGAAAAGTLALGIWATSFAVANRVDPQYDLHAWFQGLALYRLNYVVGYNGIMWNAALENLGKVVRGAAGATPLFSPEVAAASSALGLTLGSAVLWLAYKRRLTAPRLAFALAALCTHFTPVLATYHALVYAAPLLLILTARDSPLAQVRRVRVGLLFILLIFAALLGHYLPTLAMLPLLIMLSCIFPWGVAHIVLAPDITPAARTDGVLLLISALELSAIGDEMTHGIIISLAGVSGLIWLLCRTLWPGPKGRIRYCKQFPDADSCKAANVVGAIDRFADVGSNGSKRLGSSWRRADTSCF